MKCLKISDDLILIRKEKDNNEDTDYDIYVTRSDSYFLIEFYNFSNKEIVINKNDLIFEEFLSFYKSLPKSLNVNASITLTSEAHGYDETNLASKSPTLLFDEASQKIKFNIFEHYYPLCIIDGSSSKIMKSEDYLNIYNSLFDGLLEKSSIIEEDDYISKDGDVFRALTTYSRQLNCKGTDTLTRCYIAK